MAYAFCLVKKLRDLAGLPGSLAMLYSLYAEYGALTKHTPAMTNTAIAGAKTIDPADAAAPRAKPMHTLYIYYMEFANMSM